VHNFDLGQLGELEIGGSVGVHPNICLYKYWTIRLLGLLATHELMNSQGGSVGVTNV